MIYFRFNKDNMIDLKKEDSHIDFGTVQSFFFKKLRDELHLHNFGYGSCLYDVIGIPVDAHSFDNEKNDNFDSNLLMFVLSKYEKLPIDELNCKSLESLGINIELCKTIPNADVESLCNSYIQNNNLEYITESVLWKNMTDDEKVRKFSEYLSKIEASNNELIIVDPYFFSSDDGGYCKIIDDVLKRSNAKSIIVITDQKHYKKASHDKISHKVDVKYSPDFHDRFWIANRKKGFYTGTSFNGIGKKISLVNYLDKNDIIDIIEELRNSQLIP